MLVELYYAGAWQDVTADVLVEEGITLNRGLSEETLEPIPSTIKLTFLSTGGKYNPANPTSPLYGLVGRNTPIRVSVDGSVRIGGEVAEWHPSRPIVGTSRAAVVGAGILRRLGRGQKPLRSVAYRALTSPDDDVYRVAYWPFEEAAGYNARYLYTPYPASGLSGEVINDVTYGGYTDHPAAERMLVLGVDSRLMMFVPTYTAGTETKVMALWNIPGDLTPTGERCLFRMHCVGGSFDYVDLIYTNTSGHVIGLNAFSGGAIVESSAFSVGADVVDNPICLALEFSGSPNLLARIVFYTQSGIGLGDDTWNSRSLGRVTKIVVGDRRTSDIRDIDGVAVGHLIVGTDTDAFRSFAPYSEPFGFRGFVGEPAADRVERLCAEEGVPVTIIGDADESEPMGYQSIDTLTELLLECARTDSGLLYEVRGSAALQYRSGRHLYDRDTDLTMTLSMASPGVAPGLDPELSDLYVRNDVEAKSRTGSGRATLESGPMSVLAPPDGVGRYDTSLEVNPSDDDRLPHLAGWHLGRNTYAGVRFRRVTVDLDANPSLATDVNRVGLGYVVVLTDLHPEDSPDDFRGLVVQVNDRIKPDRRLVTWTLIPALPFDVGIIGDDAGTIDLLGFRIDTDLTTLNEALDTTETGVDTTGGTWTTDADNWNTGLSGGGLFLTIGGEQMRVTARAGSTFTVVRSVNGVVKSHSIGDPVHVSSPVTIGV